MKYCIETHFHTDEVSPCGRVPAVKGVSLYKEAGYSGVMVTDHISTGYLTDSYPGETWREKIDYYLRGYRAALPLADERFSVMLGMELRFEQNGNDYLIFGVTEEFLYENEWFTRLPLKKFKELATEKSLTIVQAHPFRNDMTVTDPRLIDGMEVFNGNKGHDSRNWVAAQWAKRFKLIPTSGSDFHKEEDLAHGGIYVSELPRDSRALRRFLLRGDYEIKSLE